MVSVEQIIHELMQKLEADLVREAPLATWTNAPQAIEAVTGIFSRFLPQFVEAMVEAFNDAVFDAKAARKEVGLKRHEAGRSRKILTSIGPLCLRSDVYYDAQQNKHITVLNDMMGFQRFQKVEQLVRDALLECAVFFPQQSCSVIATGGQVSTRSIRNYVRDAELPEPPELQEKRVVERLYVYIDEGHCSPQPKKSSRKHSKQIPVAVVSEGLKEERKGRKRNIRPYIIVDPGCSTAELEKQIAAYIFKTYDVSALKEICVIGDGARSIRKALDEWFPGVTRHYMDLFHLRRAVNSLNSLCPDKKAADKPAKKIYAAMRKNDRTAAEEELSALQAFAVTKGQRNKLERISSFILNCWEPNVHTMEKDSPSSCTEAMVWHVIAKRQTSDCISWSKDSMGKMAALRAYVMNGGSLRHRRESEPSIPYGPFLESLFEVPQKLNFDIFDPVREAVHYDSATQHLIHLLGTGGQLFGRQGIRAA